MLALSFFFFKQKTAYEMLRSLVGSEMCIRDSHGTIRPSYGLQPTGKAIPAHLHNGTSKLTVNLHLHTLISRPDTLEASESYVEGAAVQGAIPMADDNHISSRSSLIEAVDGVLHRRLENAEHGRHGWKYDGGGGSGAGGVVTGCDCLC
eukprot:TRINITY_DN20160_c0_g1_i1.p1 TRINITY_DN20160_c0_g1~~TRINITY_DN20160_c0_g1_i1.p1  ORF type:complete len:149 (+),score=34.09 TRINITY_DN20160_c0_g1_i1:98-544(+)